MTGGCQGASYFLFLLIFSQLLQNSDLFGTGEESDSETEGDSQASVREQRAASPVSCGEERESSGSPPPEDEARKRKRKESSKVAVCMCVCVRACVCVCACLHHSYLPYQPKKAKKAEVQMIYSDSQRVVRGEINCTQLLIVLN